MPEKVFVFISNDPAEKGFSLMRTGDNLPKLADGSSWLPIAATDLTRENLARHTRDPDLAMLNLRTRGSYVSRTTGDVIPFRRFPRRAPAESQ